MDRRTFLTTTGGGLAGILAAGRAPAFAQTREITMLTWNHFVPASDDRLKEIGAAYSKQGKVTVKIDFIRHPDFPAKLAAEVQTKAGHDIVLVQNQRPALFREHLLDVSDLAEELGKKYGGWWPISEETCKIDGRWRAVGWFFNTFPGTYRSDYFESVQEKAPVTWADLLRAGKKLKKAGHPIGFAISQCFDANDTLYPIMWAHGAKMVDKDGKTVAVNSKAMVTTIDYVREVYADCMETDVLSWDDASNNRYILSGKGSWTLNPVSIYAAAKKDVPEMVKHLDHHVPLRGPAGQFGSGNTFNLGIWNFSKNAEASKDFLRYMFEKKNFDSWIEGGKPFNHPGLRDFDKHPSWTEDPKLKALQGFGAYMRHHGWPAPPGAETELISVQFIVPNMFAKAIQAGNAKAGIEWAEKEMRKIYKG